jgi:hypothetical protein
VTVGDDGRSIGGLVGQNNGSIIDSDARASITAGDFGEQIGGLVGDNRGSVSTSYATGTLTVGDEGSKVGGLVGKNNGSGSINNSYASVAISTGSDSAAIGGLTGVNDGTVSNAFYDIAGGTINGSSVLASYGLYNDTFSGRPVGQFDDFSADFALTISSYLPPTSGVANSYDIDTVQDLKDLLGFAGVAGNTYRLTADLSLPAGFYLPNFSATAFDGNGHTVSNLTINRPDDDKLGFIGELAAGSRISNLNLTSVSVTGNEYVGGLVGNSLGHIDGSTVTGSVTGGDRVGGLAGNLDASSVTGSSASATVNGGDYVGGLVGYSDNGSINTSYATGTVTGSAYVGGLVGYSNGGSINTSYATGTATGTDNVGGLVGYSDGSSINNSYATGTATGSDYVGGLIGYSYSGSNINTSYAIGTVTGSNYVGGLVGYSDGDSIDNSYARGPVTGSDYVGGLVGYSYGGSINNSYAAGLVGGPSNTGGLVGYVDSSTVTTSFWDTQTTGQPTSAAGTGADTVDMQSLAQYFDTGWAIGVSTNLAPGYPALGFSVAGATTTWVIYGVPLPTSTSTTTTPVVIPPVAPTPPPPPVDGADTSLTGQLGTGGVSVSLELAGSTGGAGGPGNQGANTQVDMVAVTVPKAMATTGTGFSFDLPAQVRATLGTGAVQVTLADGRPLPDWIRFNPATQRFEASAVPDGGLPLRILIRAGDKEVMVVISERAE